MNDNKMKEVKDKVVGSVKEAAGKVTDNEKLEAEGKIQQGVGEAREFANDVTDKAKTVTDKLVGSTKETIDKFSEKKNIDDESKLKKGAIKDRDRVSDHGKPVTDKLTGDPDKK